MATPALKSAISAESVATSIRKQAMEAVKTIFDRAVEHGTDDPKLIDFMTDMKSGSPASLQDCEFGMTLLLVRNWLDKDFLAVIEFSKFESVTLALVKKTVRRVLEPREIDAGGEGKDYIALFTGEPYSKYQKNNLDRYSANLDAAMIILAFLASALEQFSEQLSRIELGFQEARLPGWVKSQREAALYIIQEGLQYATESRVMNNSQFQGFTCDPDSNAASPSDGYLKSNEDRLFFTWTACETINDIIDWRKSYLEKQHSTSLPNEVVARLQSLIEDLEGTLQQAAEWCYSHFFPLFEKLDTEVRKELVREINQLAGKRMSPKQREDLEQTEKQVQHVYHLSQYAAIRSLSPERVLLPEVRVTMDKLDQLVGSIIESGLDESEQPDLFKTLTRKYSLGKSNPDPYKDDAWYPLVVRSLSGLLSRTVSEIGKRFARTEVLSLVLTFQRSLESHVKKLLDRRPEGGREGPDGKLWSFAAGQPYALYATQRTVFALMRYEEFLNAAETFVKAAPDAGKREDELSMLVARRLADDYFRPIIKELLAQVPPPAPLPIASNGEPALSLPLPEEAWASHILRDWLAQFTQDFKRSQVAATLRQRAQSLRLIKQYAEGYRPSENLPQRKKENARNQLQELRAQYERICSAGEVGRKLVALKSWEVEELTAILFEYLFREYVQRPIADLLSSESMVLWKLIQDARDRQDNISNIDGAATVP